MVAILVHQLFVLDNIEIDNDPGQKVKRFREDPASFGDNISWEEKGGTYSGCWGWGTGVEEEMEGRVHPLGLRRRRRWGRRAVSRAATMPATRKARTATSQGSDMANAGGAGGGGCHWDIWGPNKIGGGKV